jgi:hypothetical protein
MTTLLLLMQLWGQAVDLSYVIGQHKADTQLLISYPPAPTLLMACSAMMDMETGQERDRHCWKPKVAWGETDTWKGLYYAEAGVYFICSLRVRLADGSEYTYYAYPVWGKDS